MSQVRFGIALLAVLAALEAGAQSNAIAGSVSPNDAASPGLTQTAATVGAERVAVQREQAVRAACIDGRRLVCGRIMDILPQGLVVESGYTNLLREPLSRSWLIPGAAEASRTENLIESKIPGGICVGLVLLSDTPKGKRAKPAKYDYVIVEAYPAGKYVWTSAGSVERPLRRFSASVLAAVQATLAVQTNTQAAPAPFRAPSLPQ